MVLYKAKAELEFEDELIQTLTQNGWTHNRALDNATPKMLENHFREILNQNNPESLDGEQLTDREMADIMRFIGGMTPVEANGFLNNGYVAEIPLTREHADIHVGNFSKVRLRAFWRDAAAGGMNRYEVIKQAIRPGMEDQLDSPNRRFDVTLLFNGMPLIQIEEKRVDVSLKMATNQIYKYKSEHKYDGLYSMVQIFVAMKENEVKYFANQKSENQFNNKFFFEWLDPQNHAVRDWRQFTLSFLKIPMAHNVISNYTLAKGDNLVVLRPYQIHAISAVRKAFENHQDGFVWHATGSGKTITAYKVATILQRNPQNQVIFLSDRKELDAQSGKNFSEFSSDTDDTVFETAHTDELISRLKSADNGVIVTTINKMKIAVERNNKLKEAGKKGFLDGLMTRRMVFIVDEAHRSQFGEMQRVIKRAFPLQSWYGFTGTPIFDFNKTAEDQTTESQFGPLLHRYDIGNALSDGAILPFNTEYVHVASATDQHGEDVDESQFSDDLYVGNNDNAQNYRNKVVHWIYKNWNKKSVHGKFNALFAVSDIQQAIEFYHLFKEKNKTALHPLHVAVTYSLNENGDDNQSQRDGLVEAMHDYSVQYTGSDSTFTLDNANVYIDDVAKRTARTEGPYKHLSPEQTIDLTIVVARLLTGFDAPRLNTLYMDKMMQYQGLIQAYARTNRVFDKNKPQGNIVLFRHPDEMEVRTKDAFEKYAGSGTFEKVFRPEFKEMQQDFADQVTSLKAYVPTPDEANALLDDTVENRVEFLKKFREVARKMQYLGSYSDFDWSAQAASYGMTEEEYGYFQGAYQTIADSITPVGPDRDTKVLKFDFEDVVINTLLIDREYVLSLGTSYLRSVKENQEDKSQEAQSKIEAAYKDFIAAAEKLRRSGKPKSADQILDFIKTFDSSKVDGDFDPENEFQQFQYQKKLAAIKKFANEFGLESKPLENVNAEYEETGEFRHEQDLKRTAKREVAESHGHKYKNVLNYKSVVQKKWQSFITDDLAQYRVEGDK
ncbi:type I restriction endonuclease subunit R [Lacticaseibacillus sharpeae]|uniref:Type I restriction enzyme endonuclease subunit n=1 Tax=Lacticaseibacillus sharpeae JCM 1186 = DSM 20505 TaxID=1291052 RepID=A0A0R1ZPM2_9LACO|nr:HsdR family type I site-specific deoxyribonuclease [Lacticaseibacillus sharpeae]KRM56322.1 type I restriction-modification system restrict [Lacticaseibacillus sharpeae JCM 1186 = DSM 20505]